MVAGFRLLGPVEIDNGAHPVAVGEPRRRAVLAALLVDAGTVVGRSTLVDRVWGDDPPAKATETLRAHLTRLRRVIADADWPDPPRIVRQPGGYRLDVDPDRVDLHLMRRLVRQARDPARTAAARLAGLRRAVALPGGEPLTGVPGDWAARTRELLHRECLDTLVAWAGAETRAGFAADVLTGLRGPAADHPDLESLTSALVRALIATGRPADALRECERHRRRLADRFGLRPGPELSALHGSLLRALRGSRLRPPVGVPGPRRSAPMRVPEAHRCGTA
ncbi:AfsR/SARP family transcriptional regulator [Catenuloplanes indicus]|uniref:DNA-binding SARP family transcriptional activator n=1 Tax=Catenuloplanes indicus TaxID=137267 RepID=A0AAE3W791_9ACTN|nr:BTAD domain-containing putative transcriptional regulator [Catenuloplanes indicus]MDQ0370811.1 DNA-binding SARP family transcriptional activator [Catenuloplanes indicus]